MKLSRGLWQSFNDISKVQRALVKTASTYPVQNELQFVKVLNCGGHGHSTLLKRTKNLCRYHAWRVIHSSGWKFEKFASENDFSIESLFHDIDVPVIEEDFGRQTSRSTGYNIDLQAQTYTETDLASFQKNFYDECIGSSSCSEEEKQRFFIENSLTVSGNNVPEPVLKFSDMNLPDHITAAMRRLKFETPTPIQSAAWPVALSGRDLVGIAQTGSGKTLSFIIPAMLHIMAQPPSRRNEGPIALVMCPTRELVMQCRAVAADLARVRVTSVYGGASRSIQAEQLSRGCELMIATPGRLMDFLSAGDTNLRRCTFLVLDEADRMLDMGFEPQIRKIVDTIRPDRQVTMWSATWPKEIQNLARDYLTSSEGPIHVKVGPAELVANANVKQHFHLASSFKKRDSFMDVMEKIEEESTNPKMLVFVNQKRTCDTLVRSLRGAGYRADGLHGDKSQRMRDRTLQDFKRGYCSVLIATDVAARGLDVKDIEYVVNYDFPTNVVDYIHRIGRTARGGKTGHAHSILTEENGGIAADLVESLENIGHPIDDKLNKLRRWFHDNRNKAKVNKRPNRATPRDRGWERPNAFSSSRRRNDFGSRGRYGEEEHDSISSRYRQRRNRYEEDEW